MQHNRFGPIAEEYEQLQGVPHILAAFEAMLTQTNDDPDAQATNACIQCLELIYYNCAEIFERFDNVYGDTSAATIRHVLWVESILEIGFDLAMLVAEQRDPRHLPDRERSSPAVGEFLDAYGEVEARLIERLEANSAAARHELSTGSVAAPFARSIHAFKNIFFLHSSIARAMGSGWGDRAAILATGKLREAVRGLQLTSDTFFCQFRLLHQIPELLGLVCIRRLRECTESLRQRDFDGAFLAGSHGTRLLGLMLSCQRPLRRLMLPAEYYAIRENLGQTSGSDSTTLRENLMREVYLELAHATEVALEDPLADGPARDRYLRMFASVRTAIYGWRQMHLSFPRNLLGGPGTVSLIGSTDGLRTAEGMARDFRSRDPFFQPPSSEPLRPADAPVSSGIGSKLDRVLLELTADIAQSRFTDVQDRTGIFEKNRKTKAE